ncbi:Ddx3y, partial [Symbiodinium sp. CCMP2456]
LDMGLHSDIRKVLRQGLPKADQRHTMIFGSASDRLHDLKGELLFIPVSSSVSGPLTIEAKECGRRIQHSWEVVRWEEKLEKLVSVVKDFLRRSRWKQQVVVFAHSVMHVRAIEAYVDGDSWLEGVHGSDSDAQVAAKHQEKWSSFSKAEKLVVACTEKGAKRKDISFATCIVNFDIPRDVEKLIKRFGQGNSRLGPSTEIVTFVSQENFAEDRAESTHEVLDELARGFESPVPPEILSLASASSTWTPAREEPTWPQTTTQAWDSASSWRRDDWYEDSSWQDNSWKDDANGKWYADTNKGDTWQNQPQWTQERADCNSWQDSGQSWNRSDPWKPAWQ